MKTSITLPAPISIQPGLIYEIRLDPLQSNEFHVYYCESLLAEIQLENNLKIKFHDDREINNVGLVNLITELGFNHI